MRTGGVRPTESREDSIAEDDLPARVLGAGDDAGTYYVRGPFWWAFHRANNLPGGFGDDKLIDLDYRDPSMGILRGRRQDQRIQLLEDKSKDITLAALIKMMTDNTVTFGSNNVELTQIFGTEGLARFDALYAKLTGLADLTDELDADTLVPWTGTAPALADYTDIALTNSVTDPGTYTPTDQAAPTTAAPAAPSAGNAAASQASASNMSALTAPSAFNATVEDVATAPTFGDDFGVFTGPIEKADVAPVAVLPSDTNISVVAPSAIEVQTITEEQLTTLEGLFTLTADPALPTITVGTPTQQTMNAEIAAAVAAFTAAENLRYAEDRTRIRASLAASRMTMSSHADNAMTLLEAAKARRIAEFTQNLVVEQAKGNLQAGMAHQELLLRAAEVQARVEQFFLDRYARITDNELRWSQGVSGVYMAAYQLNSETMLRGAMASAENAIRASIAHAENYLQFEATKAQTGTQVAVATAENYTRAALQSAQNFLQRAVSQYENLVRCLIVDAENSNKIAMANADSGTRASIANAENVVRAAIALADNVTKVAMQNADSATRVSMTNAENDTRAAITHAENALRHATTLMDLETRIKLANEENKLKADTTDRELTLRADLAKIENELKLASLNFDNRMKVETTNNEMEVRISQMLFEAKVRVIQANNARILEELGVRGNIARMVSDVTIAWMGAMTNNTGALSNIITTGMQQHVHQINTQRDFELNAESQRWQVAVQRASFMDGLASLKWKAQVQNLSVMQQTLAALGQATGQSTTPSAFANLMQGVSIAADAVSAVISTAVALA